jgi:hypothetical protein
MSYNGWKNKETWLVNLWLGDWLTCEQEEGQEISAEYIESMVQDMLDNAKLDGFLSDMMNCAIGEIDWHEIASHYQNEEQEES